jgi:hypothetical protein
MGSAMGILAHVFPSWFPPTDAEASSSRILWLYVMATIQTGIGLGYILRANVFPFVARLVSADRTADTGSLAIPKARGVAGH